MKIAAALLLFASLVHAAPPTFAERKLEIIDGYAHPKNNADLGYAEIAARLWKHEEPAWCSERLESALAAGPSGDMFWMFPVTAIAYLDQGQLTPSARESLHRAWKTYMPYRGD